MTERTKQMNEEKRINEIKKEDYKRMPVFFIAMAVFAIGGSFFGYFLASKHELFEMSVDFFKENGKLFSLCFAAAMYVFGTITAVISIVKYIKVKKLWGTEKEREDNWDLIEDKVADLFGTVGRSIIICFFLHGASIYNLFPNLRSVKTETGFIAEIYEIGFFLSLIGVVIFTALFFIIQRKSLEIEKLLNPEKNGSIFDFSFKKKWVSGFDEAEKKQVGIAAYKAYNIVNMTCTIMTVLLIIIGMFADITIVPLLCVAVIWIVQLTSFTIACAKVTGKFC